MAWNSLTTSSTGRPPSSPASAHRCTSRRATSRASLPAASSWGWRRSSAIIRSNTSRNRVRVLQGVPTEAVERSAHQVGCRVSSHWQRLDLIVSLLHYAVTQLRNNVAQRSANPSRLCVREARCARIRLDGYQLRARGQPACAPVVRRRRPIPRERVQLHGSAAPRDPARIDQSRSRRVRHRDGTARLVLHAGERADRARPMCTRGGTSLPQRWRSGA